MHDYKKDDERLKHILSPAAKAPGRRSPGAFFRYFCSGLLRLFDYSPAAVGGSLYELLIDN
jgi:hypothetical protein